MNEIKKIIEFIKIIERLKTIERFNRTSNLHRTESVAEHMWHLAIMVYLLAGQKPELDKKRLIELSLIHDLVEVYSGDVNLWDPKKKDKDKKRADERKAAIKLFSKLPKDEREKMLELWYEYEDKKTAEAVFVYALDKLQPFLQRLISGDQGWKEMMVNLKRLKRIKPKEVKKERFLSDIWDDLTKEAIRRDLLYKA